MINFSTGLAPVAVKSYLYLLKTKYKNRQYLIKAKCNCAMFNRILHNHRFNPAGRGYARTVKVADWELL